MQRAMLKSKIHRATVSDSDLHYVGSITIDPELLEAADILEHEQVHVVDVDNGARFETYTIAGARDSGAITSTGPPPGSSIGATPSSSSPTATTTPPSSSATSLASCASRHRRIASSQSTTRWRPSSPRAGGNRAREEATMSSHPDVQAPADPGRLPMTLPLLLEKKRLGDPIVMVTAYDYPSARAAEAGGVDLACSSATPPRQPCSGATPRLPSTSRTCSCSPARCAAAYARLC